MTTPLEVSTTITPADRAEAAAAVVRPMQARRRLRALVLGAVALPGGVLLGVLLASPAGTTPPGAVRLLASTLAQPVVAGWILLCAAFLLGRFVLYDRLALRRLRRWTAAEHGSDPLPVTYRFDGAGCTAVDPYSRVRVRWQAFAGLEETPGAFRLVGRPGMAISLLLPRRALAPGEEARLRALVAEGLRTASTGPATAAAPLIELPAGAEVTLRFEQTVEDRAAAQLVAWDTPRTRRLRWLYALGTAVGGSLFLPALATVDWLLDARSPLHPYPLGDVLAASSAMVRNWSLLAVASGVLVWAAWPLLLRRQARGISRLLAGNPLPVQLSLGPVGITAAGPEASWHFGWNAVRRYVEGPEHLLFAMRYGQVLSLPRRALDGAALAAVRRIVAAHTAGPRGS